MDLKEFDFEGRYENIILDIDNCVLDSREWEKYIPTENTREGWDNYHDHYYLTTPNPEMIDFIEDLYYYGLKRIYFVTAREDINNMREITINHLKNAFADRRWFKKVEKHLFMRNTCDYSLTDKVKEKIMLSHIYPYQFISLAIDDDIRNIEMYKNWGINTLYYDKFILTNK